MSVVMCVPGGRHGALPHAHLKGEMGVWDFHMSGIVGCADRTALGWHCHVLDCVPLAGRIVYCDRTGSLGRARVVLIGPLGQGQGKHYRSPSGGREDDLCTTFFFRWCTRSPYAATPVGHERMSSVSILDDLCASLHAYGWATICVPSFPPGAHTAVSNQRRQRPGSRWVTPDCGAAVLKHRVCENHLGRALCLCVMVWHR